MSALHITDRASAVVHQTEDFLADVCMHFAEPTCAVPDGPVLQAAQTAVYYALGCWLDAPVIVSPLADGLLALAKARGAGRAAVRTATGAHSAGTGRFLSPASPIRTHIGD